MTPLYNRHAESQSGIRRWSFYLSVFALLFFSLNAVAQSRTILAGQLEDGTNVTFQPGQRSSYRQAMRYIDQSASNRPKTADEYAKRMQASCRAAHRGPGIFVPSVRGTALNVAKTGWGVTKELAEEFPQEWGGDMLAFVGAQFLGAQDDPAYMVHFAEQSLMNGDTSWQIAIAVVTQMGVTSMASGLMSDLCNYYEIPKRRKSPFPWKNTQAELAGLNAEEKVVARRVFSGFELRARRALVNGGAMGIGMIIGQEFIAAKNDPNLRKCKRESTVKRWGEVSEFAAYRSACAAAARTFMSRSKAYDFGVQMITAIFNGAGTYAIREVAGASMRSLGWMDKNRVLRYLADRKLRERVNGIRRVRQIAKGVSFVARGVRIVSFVTGEFALELALEAGTGVIMYMGNQYIFQPIVVPMAKSAAFGDEMGDLTGDLDRSLDIALSGRTDWAHAMSLSEYTRNCTNLNAVTGDWTCPDGDDYRRVMNFTKPVESIMTEISFRNIDWRNHVSMDATSIFSNWQDAVKYPIAVMDQGKRFYEEMIKLGQHETRMPSPDTWDFFANPQTRYTPAINAAIDKLAANTPEASEAFTKFFYAIDYIENEQISKLMIADEREKLVREGIISAAYAARVAQADIQAILTSDFNKLEDAYMALAAARDGQNKKENIRKALESIVDLMNTDESIFSLPPSYQYRAGQAAPRPSQALNALRQGNTCGKTLQTGSAWMKTIGRLPKDETHDLVVPYSCAENDRYTFSTSVFTNRLYIVLNEYVGYPFKLAPRVEDAEAILNKVSMGGLFKQNNLVAMTPGGVFRSNANPGTAPGEVYGFDGPAIGQYGATQRQGADKANIRLRSVLDLFVFKFLCGQPLDANFVGENAIPILNAVKRGGLRMTMGAPRLAFEHDGSIPSICVSGNSVEVTKYVDYFSTDFMFPTPAGQPALIAPLRHKLVVGHGASQRQYSDFLDFALRKVNPTYLANPQAFDELWTTRIETPYNALATSSDLKNRYETLMKQTINSQGIIWRRPGDYAKCEYRVLNDIINCSAQNTMAANELMPPTLAFSAFHIYPSYTGRARTLNKSITDGMEDFHRNVLNQPIGRLRHDTGRGMAAATQAELLVYSKVIWKIAKNLNSRLLQAHNESKKTEINKVGFRLRRLFRANQLMWQVVDESTPTRTNECPSVNPGCTASKVAAVSIVQAVLPMMRNPEAQVFFKDLEVRKNAAMLATYTPADRRLVNNSMLTQDLTIDRIMQQFALDNDISVYKPLGALGDRVPNFYHAMGRTDSFFRSAKVMAMIGVQYDLLLINRFMGQLIWARRSTAPGAPFLLSENERRTLTSIVFESIQHMKHLFVDIGDQSGMVDAFKTRSLSQETQVLDQTFSETEEKARLIEDIISSRLDAESTLDCDSQLRIDQIYRVRPNLPRSLECAAANGTIRDRDMDMRSLRRFEDVRN